jgi:hypothetical protein
VGSVEVEVDEVVVDKASVEVDEVVADKASVEAVEGSEDDNSNYCLQYRVLH